MSYNPEDHIVEWRDVGAGCSLAVVALLGLFALGGGSATLAREPAGLTVVRAQIPQQPICPDDEVAVGRKPEPAAS